MVSCQLLVVSRRESSTDVDPAAKTDMTNRHAPLFVLCCVLALVTTHHATEAVEAEVSLDHVKRIPPVGVVVPPEDRAELEAGVNELGKAIDSLRDSAHADLLPDVEIFYNAVHYALKYDEFFDPSQIAKAKTLLKQGHERAAQLREGKP